MFIESYYVSGLRGCEDARQVVWIRWAGASGAVLAWFQGLIQVSSEHDVEGVQSEQAAGTVGTVLWRFRGALLPSGHGCLL